MYNEWMNEWMNEFFYFFLDIFDNLGSIMLNNIESFYPDTVSLYYQTLLITEHD